jgi:hypothetical protein
LSDKDEDEDDFFNIANNEVTLYDKKIVETNVDEKEWY